MPTRKHSSISGTVSEAALESLPFDILCDYPLPSPLFCLFCLAMFCNSSETDALVAKLRASELDTSFPTPTSSNIGKISSQLKVNCLLSPDERVSKLQP